MEFLIFGLPIVALIWLISAIIQFCRTNKENIEKRKALKKEIKSFRHFLWKSYRLLISLLCRRNNTKCKCKNDFFKWDCTNKRKYTKWQISSIFTFFCCLQKG